MQYVFSLLKFEFLKIHAQTESSSPVVFDVDSDDAVKHDTAMDQKKRTAKSQDLSKTGCSSLVQTTLSTLFKKVEEKSRKSNGPADRKFASQLSDPNDSSQMITFGGMLFSPGPECMREFPSPESLKKRVIISTKPPKEYLQAKGVEVKNTVSNKGEDSAKEGPRGREVKSFKVNIDDYKDNDLDEQADEEYEEDPKSQHNAAPEYKHLIAIHAGKGKGGMQDWLKVDQVKVRHLSLSENELQKAVLTYGKDIVRFTERNLLRIYP